MQGPKRNPLLIGGGLAAIAVVVILGFVLSSSGGGGGTGRRPATPPARKKNRRRKKNREKKPQIADADWSRSLQRKRTRSARTPRKASRKRVAEFPEAKSEEAFDVEYSEALVGISTQAVEDFSELMPPVDEQGRYRRTSKSRDASKTYDRDALEAARAEDNEAYLDARAKRDLANPERWDLAGEMGFSDCSGPGDES